jgi:hypothetical protein
MSAFWIDPSATHDDGNRRKKGFWGEVEKTNREKKHGGLVPSRNEDVLTKVVRWVLVCILLVTPWLYGGVNWSFQYILFFTVSALATLLALACIAGKDNEFQKRHPPLIAWILLSLGLFAEIQSIRAWDLESPGPSIFPSLETQRWALGLSRTSESLVTCDLDGIEPQHRRLAMSVEPITTQGASSSLFVCGLLVWAASCVWGHRKTYPSLLLWITVLGILLGGYGLVGAFLRSKPNHLGLNYGSSFSVFVSKNSAGAFLNITLAAAIGLALWNIEKIFSSVSRQMLSRDMRQWPWNAKFQYGLKTAIEKLDARTIVSGLCVLLLAFCMAMSLCRGAFVSGILAVFVAIAIAWPGRKPAAILFACFIAMLCSVIAMVGLQIDQTAASRMESIESIDIETEKDSGRLYIWGVAARAAMNYRWLGSGHGTFHVAALPFQDPSSRGWYYHAESLFAEILVTLGFLGMIATIIGLVVSVYCLTTIFHSPRFRDYLALQVAGAFFLASQTLHACIDFAWILPGVYVPSALFLGAIQGGWVESKLAYKRIHHQTPDETASRPHRFARVSGLIFAALSLFFLLLNQGSVSVLALSERMEKQFQTDGPPKSANSLVDQWIESCSNAYSADRIDRVYQSPTLLRLLAEGIVYDTRKQRWEQRPLVASSELAWNQTRPVVLRIALDLANENDRSFILDSLGGKATLDAFTKANYWYTRGQLHSPLDWRLVWGRISTAMQCSPEKLKPLVPVLASTSAHRPANLTTSSLLFYSVLSDQEKLNLWQKAIRSSLVESIPIAEIMTKTYTDGQIPIETFPEDAQILRKLYNETFKEKDFPITHGLLGDRLIQASSKTKWTGMRKASWMADVARETGNADLEIENLTIILGLDRNNVPLLKRILTLLIEKKQPEKARGFLRQLVRAAPSDPAIESFNQQLAGIEP